MLRPMVTLTLATAIPNQATAGAVRACLHRHPTRSTYTVPIVRRQLHPRIHSSSHMHTLSHKSSCNLASSELWQLCICQQQGLHIFRHMPCLCESTYRYRSDADSVSDTHVLAKNGVNYRVWRYVLSSVLWCFSNYPDRLLRRVDR